MKKYIIFIFVMLIVACGKKDLPQPDLIEDSFQWHNVVAVAAGDCLAISGQVHGNVRNLLQVKLEVQSLTDDCVNCPFLAEMSETYGAVDILDYDSSVFQIQYCPTSQHDIYRWRLMGESRLVGLPKVATQVIITDM